MDAAATDAKFRALDAVLAADSARVADLEARVSLLEAENSRRPKDFAPPGMDAAAAAAKFQALDAVLAANSARVTGLEARVALLEAENARLKKALARGVMGRTGVGDPSRLAAELSGSEHEAAEQEYGGNEDMEEDEDMEEFINDEDSSENATQCIEESCDEPEEWESERDMLEAFDADPKLWLEAVCALYRKQTKEEQLQQMHKATCVHNKKGSNHVEPSRESRIAEFLLDGDLYGPLKKTIYDLEKYEASALVFCFKVASNRSKQLFAIYQNKEDPYFQ